MKGTNVIVAVSLLVLYSSISKARGEEQNKKISAALSAARAKVLFEKCALSHGGLQTPDCYGTVYELETQNCTLSKETGGYIVALCRFGPKANVSFKNCHKGIASTRGRPPIERAEPKFCDHVFVHGLPFSFCESVVVSPIGFYNCSEEHLGVNGNATCDVSLEPHLRMANCTYDGSASEAGAHGHGGTGRGGEAMGGGTSKVLEATFLTGQNALDSDQSEEVEKMPAASLGERSEEGEKESAESSAANRKRTGATSTEKPAETVGSGDNSEENGGASRNAAAKPEKTQAALHLAGERGKLFPFAFLLRAFCGSRA
ncbi:hypothetical protein ERJ75_001581300 [Trypanosoma vivax]|uniref:Leishmanolysin-like peptidase n=1 Tax=Trypanosoma vivax (strain Y486) TaxID=1055687 RepID=F9WTT9_TRYVY|nr:hypothetical protein TRVL_07796 [Trypanosoma vivax]KAH8605685.1 hypothetical protein ERJ75_001581300 [Trypanosoma vivax]CCD20985.1 hypothetical protein, conserved in T. vivax [Trypanosoma vivax Y486]|eukprot:CCD20985.1 hypothetical protein, conserved in T. vivax [Trypanosoma vivax Y486]